jgi:hypothetical protein
MRPSFVRAGGAARRTLALALLSAAVLGCATRDDDYLLVRRIVPRADGEPTRLRLAAGDDAAATRVRRLLADGFGAELLRTLAMVKRYARRTSDAPAAGEPTLVAFGPSDLHRDGTPLPAPYRPRVVEGGWFRHTLPEGTPLVWAETLDARPGDARRTASDPDGQALVALVDGLGGAIVDLIDPRPTPLREGYLAFLEVLAAEWRPPDGQIDERTDLRARPVFAAVRANAAGHARVAEHLVREPTLIATLLHRMASSELGRRMGPDDVYLPFLAERPPRGVPAALLLGAFRNFQAKLLAAWSRAVAAGHPPETALDLVEAYGSALPAEAAEATRLFLVTTFGATVVAGGVDLDGEDDPGPRLASLTADVLFGRRSLRAAVSGARTADGPLVWPNPVMTAWPASGAQAP